MPGRSPRKWTPTEEQAAAREARIEELSEKLKAGQAELVNSDQWRAMLDMTRRAYRYSFLNSMLIFMQCPEATLVGNKKFWRDLGRWPNKQGILIRKPMEQTITLEEGDTRGPAGTKIRAIVPNKYVWVTCWDASQTDGKPLPDVQPKLLTGDAPKVLWDKMVDLVSERGYSFRLGTPPGGANGVTIPDLKEVVVRDDMQPMAQLKTLTHEVGHIRLGHTADIQGYVQHRGRAETEAESVAYYVLGACGIDTSSYSFPYIGAWSGGKAELVAETADRVTKEAKLILARIPDLEVELPAAASQERSSGLEAEVA